MKKASYSGYKKADNPSKRRGPGSFAFLYLLLAYTLLVDIFLLFIEAAKKHKIFPGS